MLEQVGHRSLSSEPKWPDFFKQTRLEGALYIAEGYALVVSVRAILGAEGA